MRRLAGVAVCLAAYLVCVAPAPVSTPVATAAENTSVLLPIGPMRLADTRSADCGCTHPSDGVVRVQVAGRDGVPTGAIAAALTITATDASIATYVTAWPSGAERPATSTVNARVGVAVANSAIIPLGVDGSIDLFAPGELAVVVDVSAVFLPATSAQAGRFVPMAPTRLLDTREVGGALPVGGSIDVLRPVDVAIDALAVLVNVTSVDAPIAGFLSGHAAGAPASTSSFLNPDGSGAPLAASVILPLSPAGVTIDAQSGGHVVVDIVGWFTGPSAPSSNDGLFVPTAPTRLLDTRASGPRVWRGGARELAAPVAAIALVTNVTIDRADAAGFVTAFPAGTPVPATSTVNASWRNATVANFAVTSLSERGTAYFANAGTDLIVDMTGWFTGTPAPSGIAPLPNVPPVLDVLLVGDSTLAALNVSTSSRAALRGFTPIVDAAPCRRLVRPSCRSAYTGQVPNTAVQAIATSPGNVDVVVMKAGYNEGSVGFDAAVVEVLSAARARGVDVVLWLTYSEGTGNQLRTYDLNNAVLRRLAASDRWPELQVAEWRAYAAPSAGWYAGDRVHLQGAGAWATADYVSRWVAAATHRPCPTPWAPGGPLDDRCPDPDTAAATLGLPDLRGLYGF